VDLAHILTQFNGIIHKLFRNLHKINLFIINKYKNPEIILEKMEIKDNTFSRQFETLVDGKLISLEYSFQEKKIFLTRINVPDGFTDEDFINDLLKNIMEIAYERKLKVVPILPKIALFFRKNTTYRDLLPPGIKI
jgi:predicted GNAT family acetyltransferase